jgi:hypothetical protein
MTGHAERVKERQKRDKYRLNKESKKEKKLKMRTSQ